MTKHFSNEVENLKKDILTSCAKVEGMLDNAISALRDRNETLAQKVIEEDDELDVREVEIEEECLKLLALHQPVAMDLRFIVSVLKINNDLERIGDLAANIAQRAKRLASVHHNDLPFDLVGMGQKSRNMLRMSIDSLVKLDTKLATEVCKADDEVDTLHREAYIMVKEQLIKGSDQIDALIIYLSVSRHLERIADLATNIAEDVIYMIDGEIVRHMVPN